MVRLKSVIFFFLLSIVTVAQNIDSLWKVATNPKFSDTVRLSAYYDLAWEFIYSDTDSALAIATTQEKLAQEVGNKKWEAKAYNAMGAAYYVRALYPKAIETYQKAIKIYDEIGDKKNHGVALGNIGSIYIDISNYEKALDYQLKCLKIVQEIGYLEGVASALNNISIIYTEREDWDEALLYNEQAIEMYKLTKDQYGLAAAFANIGEIHLQTKNYPKALTFFSYASKIIDENDFANLRSRLKRQISRVYLGTENTNLALKYALESKVFAEEEKDIQGMMDAELTLFKVYKKLGKYKEACSSYEAYQVIKDTSDFKKKTEEITRLEMQFEYDKKAAADSLKNAEEQKMKDTLIFAKNTQIENDRLQKIALYGGLFLMLISGSIMYNRFRFIQKQKNIIEAKNKETEEQKVIIEEKQKEIISSIAYAKRLQEAILPPKHAITQHLPQSFIYYKPKDIVAGDFYWMEYINDKVLIAAADCTGHGVPGAMVSVVCSNALNRSVNEFDLIEPGKVLDKARELVVETFERSEMEVKDGMDISLCLIDKNKSTLLWAGANNPLWIVREKKLIEIAPDKQAIGKVDNPISYCTQHFKLEKNDMIYLFTDGYADQFGGEKGKKFKYKQLSELLVTNAHHDIRQQQQIISETFDNWKGNLEQVDDVCVIGIRI